MKVLYVGSLQKHGTCYQRMRALRDLGHCVIGLDTSARTCALSGRIGSLLARADLGTLNLRVDLCGVNRTLRCTAPRYPELDVVWFDKPLAVRPSTLRRLRADSPGAAVVAYSPDDQMHRANHSRRYLGGLKHYDLVLTTKSFNVRELKALGARRVGLAGVGFDPATHRPVEVSGAEQETYGSQVSFVGTYEKERAEHLRRLAQEPITLKVWGNGWQKARGALGRAVMGRPVYGEEYAKVICASAINLAFLRKQMRDRITTRSVEIPACGGFMLAERTEEHLSHFAEGREAAYFRGGDELMEKIRYYLARPDQRFSIAQAARRRCLQDGYSNQHRMAEMLAGVEAARVALPRVRTI